MDPEFDELLDQTISESLAGEKRPDAGGSEKELAGYEHLAAEITRVLIEESPRLSATARARNLALLRARAAEKRGARRFNFSWFFTSAPRWAQIAVVAIIVVILANGITIASASSLPGSPLYSVKRLAEQSNVFLAPSAGERARIWMDLASRRLDEVQRLLAAQPRVDPATLDAIDESILHALTEIAGTRGTERIALLQQIIQLAVREQTVLDELALDASAEDRARFQETARLLANVANLAGAAQANPALPLLTPTGTPTATASATASEKATWTITVEATPIPTVAPSATLQTNSSGGQPTPSDTPASGSRAPGSSPTLRSGETPKIQPTDSPEGNNTATQEPQRTDTPEPQKTDSPEPQKTASPEPQKTESPEPQKTDSPEPQKTESPEPQKTDSPEPQKTQAPQPNKTETPDNSLPLRIVSVVAHLLLRASPWESHAIAPNVRR